MVGEQGRSVAWSLLRGPVRLEVDGRDVDLGPPRQRLVLAVLLLSPDRSVPVESIVERIWDGRPPRASNPVAPYVARLRRVVGGSGTLSYRSGGYRLDCDPDQVDLHRARRLATGGRAAARTGDDERAVDLLRRALTGWHAEALADLPGHWAAGMRDTLRRERADLLADWAEAGLRLSGPGCARPSAPAEVIRTLRPAVADDPVAERLVASLMAAYAATGQVTAALDCYAALRAAVADRFGSEPSAAVRDLHVRLLRGSGDHPEPPEPPRVAVTGASRVVPAQLPLDVRGFSGRQDELARLDALLTEGLTASPTVAVVHGGPGVGKTTLAVHWGHRAAARFPDGQLFVNLRGFDPGGQGMRPAQAVRGFLVALGVAADAVPPDPDAQVALYRSLLAGKRILIVLDNVRDADQARPLLPGAGTTVALLTSRNHLTGLIAAEGAHPVTLDVLPGAHARQLLGFRLGADRTAAEPDAVQQIVTACAGLPLALAIISARAQQNTFPLATIAAELTDADRRLDALDAGEASTRAGAVFSWSYAALSAPAATLFRLFGLHPGTDIGVPAAASLAGEPVPVTRRLLTELTRSSLLTEHRPGRYTTHDLLRAYAAHQARTHDDAATRRASLARLLDHHVHTAHAANRQLDPMRDPMPLLLGAPAAGVTLDPPTDRDRATAWYAAEAETLGAILRSPAVREFPGHVWQFAWALDTFMFRSGHWHELAATWRGALDAARRLCDPGAQAYAHNLLAFVEVHLGRHDRAEDHFDRALHLYGQTGDRGGAAHTHRNLGFLRWRQGDKRRALHHTQQSLAGFRAVGTASRTAHALNAVGWCHAQLGNHAEALAHCREALTLHQEVRDVHGEASTWDSLGYAYHRLADHARAHHCYTRSVELYAEAGDRFNQADALSHLGDSHRAAGDHGAASAAWRRAHDILTRLGHPDAETVRRKLVDAVQVGD
ncbi:AfsR/SARP family transcriptional regulator [Virgisporangium ochraceum]|uniref:AfsR/SARP family transcriptional regulator n=1 Tax=Virgisporangium ochraceum TaxID=65505 RepID=UPI00194569F9|nr:BTAD domain-containing putative transcriptional regulator [Virgisporangium ochraceum]